MENCYIQETKKYEKLYHAENVCETKTLGKVTM